MDNQSERKVVKKNQVLKAVKNFLVGKLSKYVPKSVSNSVFADKVRIALYVTWLWAWVGLYTAKTFESIFRAILSVPDSWLAPVSNIGPKITTTQNEKVHILNAYDCEGYEITNKLKLFLKAYWQKADSQSVSDENSFNFTDFQKLVGTPAMFCSYILSDEGKINAEGFLKNVQRLFMEKQGRRTLLARMPGLEDQERAFMNMVSFDQPNYEDSDYSDDERDLLVQDIIAKFESSNTDNGVGLTDN